MMRKALLATLLLGVSDKAERALLGRRPVYDPKRNGMEGLRWLYGPTLALVKEKLHVPWAIFGPAVASLELLAMPKWRKKDVPLLFAHSTLFAWMVEVL